MKRACLCLILALIALTGFAVSQDVRYNFDKNTDFTRFNRYEWVALKDAKNSGDLLDKQFKEVFDAQLAAKGLA